MVIGLGVSVTSLPDPCVTSLLSCNCSKWLATCRKRMVSVSHLLLRKVDEVVGLVYEEDLDGRSRHVVSSRVDLS